MVGSRKPTADAADEAETLRLINAAIAAKDLPTLRHLAASHGLLTNQLRQQGWCLLAGADPGVWDAAKYETVWSRAGHRDRQVVVVDVARSLWALMPDASDEEREAKRAQLARLLNAVVGYYCTYSQEELQKAVGDITPAAAGAAAAGAAAAAAGAGAGAAAAGAGAAAAGAGAGAGAAGPDSSSQGAVDAQGPGPQQHDRRTSSSSSSSSSPTPPLTPAATPSTPYPGPCPHSPPALLPPLSAAAPPPSPSPGPSSSPLPCSTAVPSPPSTSPTSSPPPACQEWVHVASTHPLASPAWHPLGEPGSHPPSPPGSHFSPDPVGPHLSAELAEKGRGGEAEEVHPTALTPCDSILSQNPPSSPQRQPQPQPSSQPPSQSGPRGAEDPAHPTSAAASSRPHTSSAPASGPHPPPASVAAAAAAAAAAVGVAGRLREGGVEAAEGSPVSLPTASGEVGGAVKLLRQARGGGGGERGGGGGAEGGRDGNEVCSQGQGQGQGQDQGQGQGQGQSRVLHGVRSGSGGGGRGWNLGWGAPTPVPPPPTPYPPPPPPPAPHPPRSVREAELMAAKALPLGPQQPTAQQASGTTPPATSSAAAATTPWGKQEEGARRGLGQGQGASQGGQGGPGTFASKEDGVHQGGVGVQLTPLQGSLPEQWGSCSGPGGRAGAGGREGASEVSSHGGVEQAAAGGGSGAGAEDGAGVAGQPPSGSGTSGSSSRGRGRGRGSSSGSSAGTTGPVSSSGCSSGGVGAGRGDIPVATQIPLHGSTTESHEQSVTRPPGGVRCIIPHEAILPVTSQSVYYYQGLHDVASVLLLVLGSEAAAFPVLQRLVGNQLRDATRASLDAVMELLDLTFPLLEECDPQLASLMKGAELPPFFALSWTITWWAHDVPRLQDVARLFDLFLAAHPCMPLYLGVAAMCCMRSQLLGLEEMPLLHTALVNLELPPSSTADPPQAAPSGAQSSVGGNAGKTGTAKAKRGALWGLRRAKKARGPPPPDLTNLILEAIALFDAHPPAHLVWSRGLRLVSSVGTAAMLDTAGSGWKVPAVPPAPLSQPPTNTTAIGCTSSAGTRPRGRGALGKADGRGGEARGTAGVRSSLRAQGAAAVQFIRLLHIVFRAALVGWPWIRPPPHLRSPVQWLQLQPVVHTGSTRALPAPPPSPPPPLNPLVRRSDVSIKTGAQRAAGEGLRSLLRPPCPSAASHVPHLSASQTMVPDRPAITPSPGSRVETTPAVTAVTPLMSAVLNHQLPSSRLASTGDAPATLSVAVPTARPSLVASNSGLVESLANDPGSAAGLRASSRAEPSDVASHPLQVVTPAAQWHSDVPTSSPQVRQPSQSHQRSEREEARQGSGQPRLDQGTSSPTNEEHPQHRAPSSADGSRLPRAEDEILRQRAASPQQRLSPRVHQRVAHRRRESESKRSEGKPSHDTTGTVSSTCAALATVTQQRHMLTSVLTSMTGIVGVCVAAILISFALTGSRK